MGRKLQIISKVISVRSRNLRYVEKLQTGQEKPQTGQDALGWVNSNLGFIKNPKVG